MRQRSGDYFSFAVGKPGRRLRSVFLSWVVLLGLILPALAGAQPNMASIHFDDQTRVFRIDAADMSYVLGINENKQVQTLYWGKRLSAGDTFAAPHSDPGLSSFDSSINTTRLDFVAWGGGLYVEPDLKVTFPDGNRDLVLQYVSHTIEGDHLTHSAQGHIQGRLCPIGISG